MTEMTIPCWVYDRTSQTDEVVFLHTPVSPLVALLQPEERPTKDPPFGVLSGGWIAAPVYWFGQFDHTTFNTQEMADSLNTSFKYIDRVNS